jgi:hypothetical protein
MKRFDRQPDGVKAMPAPGERILVPTEVGAGAFPNEKLVTVETQEGPVSGFARADFVVTHPNGEYLMAEVKDVTADSLTVRLFGSFFTTTGLATIRNSPSILKTAG